MNILAHHGVAPVVHPTAFIAGGAWLIGDVELGEASSVSLQRGAPGRP
jgi:carbonic anhydrase/acetyltransferase-like protein (isoleucine patch superfamily)